MYDFRKIRRNTTARPYEKVKVKLSLYRSR